VAVAAGLNVNDPLTGRAGDPAARGSGASVTDVAFAVVQASVTSPPAVTPVTEDENELIVGGCCAGGGGGVGFPAAPAPPHAVKNVSNDPRQIRTDSLKTRALLDT